MAKFITLGCYTAKGLAGFVNNPETDRKAATSALATAAGAKLTRYAGLRGKYDFMAEMEGTFDQAAAAAMVAHRPTTTPPPTNCAPKHRAQPPRPRKPHAGPPTHPARHRPS